MADLSKLRFNGTDYNVKDASAPLRKFTNYSKTGNLPITSDDTTQTAIGKLEKALDDKINTSAKGTSNGVAELDANGKVPSSQLPSYVDDVLEYSAKSSFPATGETGKIYVDTSTNKTYRWSGSAYVEISPSLALGETSSTAYRGDRGKAAYDHSQTTSGNPHNVTKSDVGLGNVGNFKAVSTVASQGLSSNEKANARANIGAGTGNGTYSKPSGGIPKSDLSQLVQNSLDLADSALQSESDPTVPSWAKQTNKPSYTQDEVTDGTTYKRVTQTEKNAWSGKQSALTTTQMSAVNSGITASIVSAVYKAEKTLSNYTDLNDLMAFDKIWISSSSATSQTMVHTPWTIGGMRIYNEPIVARSTTNLFYQYVIPNTPTGEILFRRRYASNGWEKWYKLVAEAVQ